MAWNVSTREAPGASEATRSSHVSVWPLIDGLPTGVPSSRAEPAAYAQSAGSTSATSRSWATASVPVLVTTTRQVNGCRTSAGADSGLPAAPVVWAMPTRGNAASRFADDWRGA